MIRFTPKGAFNRDVLNDKDVLFDILNIMDNHADTEHFRTIQIQLSRVVLYHLAQKGILLSGIQIKEISKQKILFLCDGTKPRFSAFAFGFYYSELAVIRELTGISYQEMFTGIADE